MASLLVQRRTYTSSFTRNVELPSLPLLLSPSQKYSLVSNIFSPVLSVCWNSRAKQSTSTTPVSVTHHNPAKSCLYTEQFANIAQPPSNSHIMPSKPALPPRGWASEHDSFVRRCVRNGEDPKSVQILFETEYPKIVVNHEWIARKCTTLR